MTIWTKQFEIIKLVVCLSSSYMVEFRRNRQSKPFRSTAFLAFRLLRVISNEADTEM